MIQTKAQQYMVLAEKCVSEAAGIETVQGIYKGLCKTFPILVQTCGLCQAVAFCEAKAKSSEGARGEAHQLLLEHVGKLLDLGVGPQNGLLNDVPTRIRKAETTEYMRFTRCVFAGWIYFKRFADSLIAVEAEVEKT